MGLLHKLKYLCDNCVNVQLCGVNVVSVVRDF